MRSWDRKLIDYSPYTCKQKCNLFDVNYIFMKENKTGTYIQGEELCKHSYSRIVEMNVKK